jgi:hypothetical protein
METVIVVLVVAAAVAWAGRESWRALRPKGSTSAGGCPSAGRCAVAHGCSRSGDRAPVEADRERRSAGDRVT